MSFGMIVESAVAVLLAATIGYCMVLNQRLKRLHADRDMLRQIVTDLVQATGLANSAIKELKMSAVEADLLLKARLEEAERFGVELANHVNAGQGVMDRLARITKLSRPPAVPQPAPMPEPTRIQSALAQLAARDRNRDHAA